MRNPYDVSATLAHGEPWERLEAMQKLEEIAIQCRTEANAVIGKCTTPAELEKLKPWRSFRRKIGFPLFNLVLKIAQGPSGTQLRDLAADILAHLWHPAAVDRLVEDLSKNGDALRPSQLSGIFDNLAGIGNEPALKALLKLWDEGYEYDVVIPIGSCNSKVGEAFLMRQAREHKDSSLRGYCILAFGREHSPEKVSLLRDKLKNGTPLERSAAIRRIGDMGLISLSSELIAIHNGTNDEKLKTEILDTLRYLHNSRHQAA